MRSLQAAMALKPTRPANVRSDKKQISPGTIVADGALSQMVRMIHVLHPCEQQFIAVPHVVSLYVLLVVTFCRCNWLEIAVIL